MFFMTLLHVNYAFISLLILLSLFLIDIQDISRITVVVRAVSEQKHSSFSASAISMDVSVIEKKAFCANLPSENSTYLVK